MERFIAALKATISEMHETGTKAVTQPGAYLYFDAINPLSRNKDSVTFQIIIAGNSLAGKSQAIIPTIESIRERLRQAENEFNGVDIFKGVQAVSFEGSLFVYAMTLEIELYKGVLHDETLSES